MLLFCVRPNAPSIWKTVACNTVNFSCVRQSPARRSKLSTEQGVKWTVVNMQGTAGNAVQYKPLQNICHLPHGIGYLPSNAIKYHRLFLEASIVFSQSAMPNWDVTVLHFRSYILSHRWNLSGVLANEYPILSDTSRQTGNNLRPPIIFSGLDCFQPVRGPNWGVMVPHSSTYILSHRWNLKRCPGQRICYSFRYQKS